MNIKQYIDAYAFDVDLDETGLRLDLYSSGIRTEINNYGKKESYRFFEPLFSGYPEHLESMIKMLRVNRAFAVSDLVNDSFDNLIIDKPLGMYKVQFFKPKNKVLQKIYCEKVVDDMCYLYTYVIMINTHTGQLKAVFMQSMGLWDEEKVRDLEKNGYYHISDTCLMDYLQSLGNKSIKLERINNKA